MSTTDRPTEPLPGDQPLPEGGDEDVQRRHREQDEQQRQRREEDEAPAGDEAPGPGQE
jgi:hypothetical protein